MTPWFWRLGAGFSAFGALAIAPCLASALILFSLDLPLSGIKPGLWHDYWQVLDQPAYRPYAARIRFWASLGLALPPLVWCAAMHVFWRRWRSLRSPPMHLPFDSLTSSTLALPVHGPGAIPVTKRRGRTLAAAEGTSVLVSAPFYPEAHAVVVDTVRRAGTATLVIDVGGRSYAYARPRRGRTLLRLCPFGGGRAWNPLAGAWHAHGLDPGELRELAAAWFPDAGTHDRFIASHVRNAFVSLVHVIDEVARRGDGITVPVAPGDLHRLCAPCRSHATPRDFLQTLLRKPDIGPRARLGLNQWLALDDGGIDKVWTRLIEALAAFADPALDEATRGTAMSCASFRQTDVYLDIPDRWRAAAGPLIASAIRQWQAAPGVDTSSLLVVHALDTLPRIDALTDNAAAWRCVATTRGIAAVRARYGNMAHALACRFTLCAVHTPREDIFAREESEALKAFTAAQHDHPPLLSAPASARELMSLRPGEQIVSTASLRTPVICRTLTLPRKPKAAPLQTDHGEPMPIPRPLIAFLATLVATSERTEVATTSTVAPLGAGIVEMTPTVEATLGPYRFRFPKNMYYQQSGPDSDGGVRLGVQWPSLEPLPLGTDYHGTTAHFLSNIGIDLATVEHLTDAEYRTRLRRSINSMSPNDPKQRSHPATNLAERVEQKPVYGLIPYYVDFEKFRRYYVERHGENGRPPDPAQNDDWFIAMGTDGIPTTVIECSSHLIQDGARIEDGRIVDTHGSGRRSTCRHEFLIPEYRLLVTLYYLRVVMPDWRRLEAFVRQTLKNREVR